MKVVYARVIIAKQNKRGFLPLQKQMKTGEII